MSKWARFSAILMYLAAACICYGDVSTLAGGGTADQPYQIGSFEDLMAMRADPNCWDKHFIMTADIDLDPNLPGRMVFDRAVIAPDVNTSATCFQGTMFSGVFNGDGHVVYNMRIDVEGEYFPIGQRSGYLGFFGQTDLTSEVRSFNLENLHISVYAGKSFIGGLFGVNSGKCDDCIVAGQIVCDTWTSNIGGISGYNTGSIVKCASFVDIEGGSSIGGLVGCNDTGYISDSYSTGNIKGRGNLGGLVGTNGEIEEDRRHGQISCENPTALFSNEIGNSFSTANVTGYDRITNSGGLVGACKEGLIYNAFSTGSISGGYKSGNVGGLIGVLVEGEISGCRADTFVQVGGSSYVIGGLVGRIDKGLVTRCRASGAVETGSGSGHIGGLCGENQGGVIYKCCAAGNISGSKIVYVGGFLGWNYREASVIESASEGNVSCEKNSRRCGGFVGQNDNVVDRCFSTGTVYSGKSSLNLGGFSGLNKGTISNCYGSGSVFCEDLSDYIGGFVGFNYGGVIHSYSNGRIEYNGYCEHSGGFIGHNEGNIASVYFLNGGGHVISDGTALSAHEMLNEDSFEEWDFTNVWKIEEGDYPSFIRQIETARLPRVVESSFKLAAKSLEQAGFLVGGIFYGYSDEIAAGEVFKQSPEFGSNSVAGRAVNLWVSLGPSPYSGGDGFTEETAFEISSFDELMHLRNNSIDRDKYFRLMADIDLDPNLPGRGIIANVLIDFFYGSFDGGGHKILNPVIATNESRVNSIGLFGIAASSSVIKNVNIENGQLFVGNECENIGFLISENLGLIENCSVRGKVSSEDECEIIGGMVGKNRQGIIRACRFEGTMTCGNKNRVIGGITGLNIDGTIEDCSSNIHIVVLDRGNRVGGLLGENDTDGVISDCCAETVIIGKDYCYNMGGLIGRNEKGQIIRSHSDAIIRGLYDAQAVGGLVGGSTDSIIIECYAICNINVGSECDNIGGLTGFLSKGIILNCYTVGSISAGDLEWGIGGMTGGANYFNISNSYAYVSISPPSRVISYSGGFVANLTCGELSDCFWNRNLFSGKGLESIGNSQPPCTTSIVGLRAITTLQFRKDDIFLKAGWDFDGETANGQDDIWFIDEGVDYPRLCFAHRPVAVAGEDLAVCARGDGYAVVTLDGGDSSDPDGDELVYLWVWQIDGQDFWVQGATADIELPVGEHVVELYVDDGILVSAPDAVTVVVNAAVEPAARFSPRVLNSSSKGKIVHAKFELPAGFSLDAVDVNEPFMLEPLGIESRSIRAALNDAGMVEVMVDLDRSALADIEGEIELTLTGKLTTGQCLAATGKIEVFDRSQKLVFSQKRY